MLFLRKNIKKGSEKIMSCKSRITVVYIILTSMLAFVILRLYIVSSADTASQVLSGQYSRKLTVAERHGFIFDRNGKLLNSIKDGNICVVNPLIWIMQTITADNNHFSYKLI